MLNAWLACFWGWARGSLKDSAQRCCLWPSSGHREPLPRRSSLRAPMSEVFRVPARSEDAPDRLGPSTNCLPCEDLGRANGAPPRSEPRGAGHPRLADVPQGGLAATPAHAQEHSNIAAHREVPPGVDAFGRVFTWPDFGSAMGIRFIVAGVAACSAHIRRSPCLHSSKARRVAARLA